MSKIDLIIFDCDGVLVDSERICNQVLTDLLSENGASATFTETVDKFMGKSLAQTLEMAATMLGSRMPSDFRLRLAERTRASLTSSLELVAGVKDLLASLAVPHCVASNANRAKMEFSLTHTGLLERFRGRMFCADDVACPKPAPDLFLHAARTLGAEPGRCVVVEDTPTGIAAATAAGMQVYAYAGLTPISKLQAAGPTGIIHDMLDVLTLAGMPQSAVSL